MTKPVFVLILNYQDADGKLWPTLSERGEDAAEVFRGLKQRAIGHGWIKSDPDRESPEEYFARQVEAEGPPEPTHPSPLDLQDLDKWFADQDQSIPLVQTIATAATEAIAKLVRADKIKRLEEELHQLKHFPKGQ